VWSLCTLVVEFFVVSVIVVTGALFRAQIGRVEVFNTNFYLAPSLDIRRAVPLLPLYASHNGFGLIFSLNFKYELKVRRLQSLDANDSSTIRIKFQQPFNIIIYPICHCRL
jgi:hypothetical protein